MSKPNAKPIYRRWYASLWFLVLVFMCGGIIFGIVDPTLAKQSKPVIDAFIHVIKILVGPIVYRGEWRNWDGKLKTIRHHRREIIFIF